MHRVDLISLPEPASLVCRRAALERGSVFAHDVIGLQRCFDLGPGQACRMPYTLLEAWGRLPECTEIYYYVDASCRRWIPVDDVITARLVLKEILGRPRSLIKEIMAGDLPPWVRRQNYDDLLAALGFSSAVFRREYEDGLILKRATLEGPSVYRGAIDETLADRWRR